MENDEFKAFKIKMKILMKEGADIGGVIYLPRDCEFTLEQLNELFKTIGSNLHITTSEGKEFSVNEDGLQSAIKSFKKNHSKKG